MQTGDKAKVGLWERLGENGAFVAFVLIGLVVAISLSVCVSFYESRNQIYAQMTERMNELSRFQETLAQEQAALRAQLAGTAPAAQAVSGTVETIPSTDSQIDFFTNQVTGHQAFIEREREFLVKMLGVILAGGGALLAFTGWNRKKEIRAIVDQECKAEINARVEETIKRIFRQELGEVLGGEDKVAIHVRGLVEKDERAKDKNLLFIKQKGSAAMEEVIDKYKGIFRDDKHRGRVDDIVFSPEVFGAAGREGPELRGADIVVFEVSAKECEGSEKAAGSEYDYVRMVEYCASKGKACVLFCYNFRVELGLIGGARLANTNSTIEKAIEDYLRGGR